MPLLKSVDPQSGVHFSDLFYPSCKKRAAQSTECNGKSGTNRKGFYPSFFHTWRDRPWGGRCWLENLPRETEQARMSDHPCSLMAAALRKMFWMEGRVLHFKAVPGNAGTAAERGINYTGPCLSGNTHATANQCQQNQVQMHESKQLEETAAITDLHRAAVPSEKVKRRNEVLLKPGWDKPLDGIWVRALSPLHLHLTAGLHLTWSFSSPVPTFLHFYLSHSWTQHAIHALPLHYFKHPLLLNPLFSHDQQLGAQIDWKLWCSINNTINRLQMAQQEPGTPERSKPLFSILHTEKTEATCSHMPAAITAW